MSCQSLPYVFDCVAKARAIPGYSVVNDKW